MFRHRTKTHSKNVTLLSELHTGWHLKLSCAKHFAIILTILRPTFGLWVKIITDFLLSPTKAKLFYFSGITMIEFAQREPPNHQMSPMRVLLKVQKGDPPKLENPSCWSRQFNDFIAKCLHKDPNQRPTATELLGHPFLKNASGEDKKAVLAIISEYKAEVFEEVVEVHDEEVSCIVYNNYLINTFIF